MVKCNQIKYSQDDVADTALQVMMGKYFFLLSFFKGRKILGDKFNSYIRRNTDFEPSK